MLLLETFPLLLLPCNGVILASLVRIQDLRQLSAMRVCKPINLEAVSDKALCSFDTFHGRHF